MTLFPPILKRLIKKKWFWPVAVVGLVVLAGIGYAVLNPGPTVEYTTEAVQRGVLTQTVTATGAVESSQEIDLNFQVSGKLVYLNAREGQVVRSGEVLARLDAGTLAAQMSQYRANVASAQADLAKVLAGASPEESRVSVERLLKTQSDLGGLLTERDRQVASLSDKTVDATSNALSTAQVALDKLYYSYVNPDDSDITNYLWVDAETPRLDRIRVDYGQHARNLERNRSAIAALATGGSPEKIFAVADQVRNDLLALIDMLNSGFVVANDIGVNQVYTTTVIATMKSDFDSQRSLVSTALTSIQTAKSNLVDSISTYDKQIQAAQSAVSVAQAELEQTQAGPRSFELDAARAAVAQAQAQLARIAAEANQYTITAPIGGTVTKVNAKLGEQTAVSSPVITMLSTEKFQVEVDIPESDITKVSLGDKVGIELDAFGSDRRFTGAVAFVDPGQTVIQDVIYYRATIAFDANSWNDQIKPGMTADATITTDQREGALYIPQRAVRIKEATLDQEPQRVVEVLQANGQVEERLVTLGLRADDGLVEVLSGLTEGELVVTFKKELK